MAVQDKTVSSKNRKQLILLFAIGFIPLFVAYAMFFYFPTLIPGSTTNEGTLFSPPISLAALQLQNSNAEDMALQGTWSLIIPVGSDCDADCESRFYLAHQVNIALGKNENRVKRILAATQLTPKPTISKITRRYPKLSVAFSDTAIFNQIFAPWVVEPINGNYIYLADANGNIILFYGLQTAGKPMLKDLKHLLKISNIG